jgi:hypothetical protein
MIREGVTILQFYTKDFDTCGEKQHDDCLHIAYALSLPQINEFKKKR